jgi:hypothetical protein
MCGHVTIRSDVRFDGALDVDVVAVCDDVSGTVTVVTGIYGSLNCAIAASRLRTGVEP